MCNFTYLHVDIYAVIPYTATVTLICMVQTASLYNPIVHAYLYF